ncbi:MAG TPA: hypothetical protein VNQ76_02850 [Planctomicrobium sp.]|nr:hypothetical protein [Planctomicrobium sp.]
MKFNELVDLAYWHKMERWNHTSEILAMIANTIPGGSSFTAEQFHPLMQEEARERTAPVNTISYLESVGL